MPNKKVKPDNLENSQGKNINYSILYQKLKKTHNENEKYDCLKREFIQDDKDYSEVFEAISVKANLLDSSELQELYECTITLNREEDFLLAKYIRKTTKDTFWRYVTGFFKVATFKPVFDHHNRTVLVVKDENEYLKELMEKKDKKGGQYADVFYDILKLTKDGMNEKDAVIDVTNNYVNKGKNKYLQKLYIKNNNNLQKLVDEIWVRYRTYKKRHEW
ncbi:MAG: hypothetical protein NTY74_13900 [Ignavibacteriae bacterium]|nr:hypothetical protein [Ignavibacteriota bacterium]